VKRATTVPEPSISFDTLAEATGNISCDVCTMADAITASYDRLHKVTCTLTAKVPNNILNIPLISTGLPHLTYYFCNLMVI
jgi:hypothetical protein